MKKEGFRIIRLDRRMVPDAIAIKKDSVVAVEVDTNPTNIWLTRRKFKGGSQYDEEIIVTRPYNDHYHTPETYYEALRLRKSGNSYREIRDNLVKKFNLEHLAVSTIVDWVKGRKRPLGV